jgi:glycosyltransferase involved in cell wall biosynthesis
MKVGYLVNTYPSPSHSFIRREIRALERMGIEVHRFALRADRGPLVDPADLEELARTEHVLDRAGRLPLALVAAVGRKPRKALGALRLAVRLGRRSARGVGYHLVYLAEAAYLSVRCRQLGVGHLHAHFGTNSATVAMLADALGGPRFSFTVHGPEEFDRPEALALGEKVRRAAFTVAVSAYGRSQLCRWAEYLAWERIHVVHCGIEPARFPAVAPLPHAHGRTHLVAIGRLAEQKGQLLLIDALADAVAAGADLTLALVGDGPMRPEIEARIAARGLASRVGLTGWLAEAGVRAELARAHALVMPSFAEGLPMVIMEAMAAARPVIATYVAGIPELVRPGETGWLVPAGDAAGLGAALREVCRAPRAELEAMGEAGRARALARHDVAREAARLAAHFRSAAEVGATMPAVQRPRRWRPDGRRVNQE